MSQSSASMSSSGPARFPEPYIVVEGFGSVDVVPDFGAASATVEVERHDLPAARREAITRMNAVLAALDSLHVPARDIQTSRFAVEIVQEYQNGRRVFQGYRVTHRLGVHARPPERLGEIIDAVFEAGATGIDGIGFFADDPEAALREARNRAVADALAKARQLAELTGVKVGRPLQIEEPPREVRGEPFARPRRAAMMASSAEPTTISPGEESVDVHLRIYFAIV
ncbi:MAG TPA: SIMPL domain-containing protein [Thermomicrobiaceae bacterium]|nr:SIMPL domain-containing protein [Thermomicrobiaceae bacterium]